MKPYRVLIFDWDGTLADSTAQIVRRVQTSFSRFGWPPPAEAAVRDIIGLSLHDALTCLHPGLGRQEIDDISKIYQQDLLLHREPAVLFGQADSILQRLRQHYWLAVATGQGRRSFDLAMADTGTADLFLTTRTPDECAPKPQPEMVLSICDELGVHPAEALVIGDTTHDLQMALNARSSAVALTTGAHTAAQLQTVPHLATLSGLGELADWLETA